MLTMTGGRARPTFHSPGARSRKQQVGTSMIEVLISIVIVVLGLLGLAGLQSRAQLAEAESFQRAQAVVLLQDMVDRIQSNRRAGLAYVTAGEGTGKTVQTCSATAADPVSDLCEWSNALLGASESAGGLKVGAMTGARGCVTNIQPAMPRVFLVEVAWQGINPTAPPGAGLTCGQGMYGAENTRRVLSSTVVIGCLQNNTASGACVTP